MKKKIGRLFDRSACISVDTMYAYNQGDLSKEEKRLVEEHLSECELCAEAVEFLADGSLSKDELTESITTLKVELDKKYISSNKAKTLKAYWWIAASLVLLIGLSVLLRDVFDYSNSVSGVAYQQKEMPRDTIVLYVPPPSPKIAYNEIESTPIPMEQPLELNKLGYSDQAVGGYDEIQYGSSNTGKAQPVDEEEKRIYSAEVHDMLAFADIVRKDQNGIGVYKDKGTNENSSSYSGKKLDRILDQEKTKKSKKNRAKNKEHEKAAITDLVSSGNVSMSASSFSFDVEIDSIIVQIKNHTSLEGIINRCDQLLIKEGINPVDSLTVQWLKVILFLQEGKKENAIQLLDGLSNYDNPYQIKSKSILEKEKLFK